MTSILSHYSQNDTRLEYIKLTGSITNNGTATTQPAQHDQPAYGAIDLRLSKNFFLDARQLTLRTDPPTTGAEYLVSLYLTSTRPPKYNPNYEFNLIVTPPLKGGGTPGLFLFLNIYTNKNDAYNNPTKYAYQLVNVITYLTPPVVSQSQQVITFQVVNNTIVLKTLPPGFVLTTI
jgi:hypothetical protein